MDFSYKKRSNHKLFDSLALLNVSQVQNYVPLYNKFFELTAANYASVNLNQPFYLAQVKEKTTENMFLATVQQQQQTIEDNKKTGLKRDLNVFFKFSPLLDPFKYMLGKYDLADPNLFALPTLEHTVSCHPKIRDVNNLAYVDSFFTYLTSQLLHTHQFVHGIDFYGSYLALKHNFAVNVFDDIENLQESVFFKDHYDQLFQFEVEDDKDIVLTGGSGLDGSRSNRRKIQILNNDSDNLLVNEDVDIVVENVVLDEDVAMAECNLETVTVLSTINENVSLLTVENLSLATTTTTTTISSNTSLSKSALSNTSCSSRSSNTDIDVDMDLTKVALDDHDVEMNKDEKDDEEDEDGYSTIDDDEDEDEDKMNVLIKTFPVQIIALECCENTLDALLMDLADDMKDDEWAAITLQILMILITYQQVFGLTHNDLHTNNIMYVLTDKPFLYYKVADDKVYKVPTFGRIFKVIDFGRAIYQFRGQTMCSDSYDQEHGDAATQYNCEPFLNPAKPILLPNPSFDLCRLGCALFDFLVDDIKDTKKVMHESAIKKVILSWCLDDKGRNVIYKNNGEERYPDFKLYKMIARTVHNHVPIKVLLENSDQQSGGVFAPFLISVQSKKYKKEKFDLMDITALPSYQ